MLHVGFSRHHAYWNWQGVSSPFTRLFLVTEGEAKIHLPSEVVTLRPGHAYMVPAYVPHSYECHGDFALYYLHVYEVQERGRHTRGLRFPHRGLCRRTGQGRLCRHLPHIPRCRAAIEHPQHLRQHHRHGLLHRAPRGRILAWEK